MNMDVLKGNWKELSGKAKAEWGLLTGDEVMQAEGDREQLTGLIQEKYGLAKEEAQQQVDAFISKHS